MKLFPFSIALLLGLSILAVGLRFNYYPPVPQVSASSFDTPEEYKARLAVSAMMLFPEDASVSGMRTVKPNGVTYICGRVSGRDKSGSYVGAHDFVYELASNYASVNDDESISKIHRFYTSCPEEQTKTLVDLDKIGKNGKVAAGSDGPGGVELSTSTIKALKAADDVQDTRRKAEALAAQVKQAAQTIGSSSIDAASAMASRVVENDWRGDAPPKAWPRFAADDPLSQPEAPLAIGNVLALATETERKWKSFTEGQSTSRPSVMQIEETLRALMTINEQSPDYPKAWAVFVRLRKICRDQIAQR